MVTMQEPVCFINNEEDGGLGVQQEALEILNQIKQPVVVVAIVGLYRLAGKTTGFALGNTVESKTKGIWMWCVPHPSKKEEKEKSFLLELKRKAADEEKQKLEAIMKADMETFEERMKQLEQKHEEEKKQREEEFQRALDSKIAEKTLMLQKGFEEHSKKFQLEIELTKENNKKEMQEQAQKHEQAMALMKHEHEQTLTQMRQQHHELLMAVLPAIANRRAVSDSKGSWCCILF